MIKGPEKVSPVRDIRGWCRDPLISDALQNAHALPDELPVDDSLRGLLQQISQCEGER